MENSAEASCEGWAKEFVFEPGEAPFRSCHAATLAETAPGEFCAAWFGGTKESAPDTAIWLARRIGGVWTSPERVARVRDEAHWNPVLFHDGESGKTVLFFKVGMYIPSWETWFMRSRDGGRSWSEPVELVPGDRGGRGPVKNKPIRLSNGDWLAPASLEGVEGNRWVVFVDRSSDAGRTWEAGPVVPLDMERIMGVPAGRSADGNGGGGGGSRGAIQPSLWESEPGRVHMLMRSTFGRLLRSDSDDFGRTWRPAYPTDMPNNNSGIDVARLPDGRLLLLCNPVGENWGPRTPLSAFISSDNGKTWVRDADLENEPAAPGAKPRPEFSYPSVIACSGGAAAVYTWKRKAIAFAFRRIPS